MMYPSVFHWSGGKDSCMALYEVQQDSRFQVRALHTNVSQAYGRVSMHGLRAALLEKQAASLGLPLHKLLLPASPDMPTYDRLTGQAMRSFQQQGITHAIFGDIFLEDLKAYREEQMRACGMQACFPLWQQDTRTILHRFIDLGFKAMVVCVQASVLDKSFAGRIVDKHFLQDLPPHVDPCGENGEYHTFVFDGPIFKEPIGFIAGELMYQEYQHPNQDEQTTETSGMGFWYQDLLQP